MQWLMRSMKTYNLETPAVEDGSDTTIVVMQRNLIHRTNRFLYIVARSTHDIRGITGCINVDN